MITFLLWLIVLLPLGNGSNENEDLKIEDKIVNPHDYDYILNPGESVCSSDHGDKIHFLVYAHSDAEHYQLREYVRETWAFKWLFPELRVIFMVGNSKKKINNDRLLMEYEKHRDIVQENFLEDYRNMTLKAIMAMKWISQYCSKVKYLVKVDDDMIVNTRRLIEMMDRMKPSKGNTILCAMNVEQEVFRDPRSPQHVPIEEFPYKYFRNYCTGAFYILNAQLAPLIYNISLYIRAISIDDYYITGAAVRPFNVTYVDLDPMMDMVWTKKNKNYIDSFPKSKKIFLHCYYSMYERYAIWNNILLTYDLFS